MRIRRVLSVAGQTAVVVVVLSVVLGSLLGQPILLGYVTTESMQPTLDPGDGYVAIPTAIAGPVEEGDVVVFRAEQVNGGRLTAHRVVGETDRGYVTKGDANPFTDQDGGEPPVKRAQVVAKALQVGGHVVVIPHLGTVVGGIRTVLASVQRHLATLLGTRELLGVRGLAYLLFATALLWYGIDLWREGRTRSRGRDRSRATGTDVRLIVAAFAALLVVAATASMVAPAGPREFGVVSAEFDSPGARVVPTGESESLSYRVSNTGVLPVVVFLEPGSEGVDVRPRELRVPPRSTANATATLSAPPETGFYRRFLVEHRYLAVLPQPTIRALYRIHPWLPVVVIDALLAGPFYLLGVRLVGTGRVRSRSREGPSRARRLRSRLTSTMQFSTAPGEGPNDEG